MGVHSDKPHILIYADYGTGNYVVKRRQEFICDLARILSLPAESIGYIDAAGILETCTNSSNSVDDEKCVPSWMRTTSLLIMPGGFDKGYCEKLNGEGNRRIRSFVEDYGGRYLGFCAGAYYGSGECVFDMFNYEGNNRIVEQRELRFFPNAATGPFLGPYYYASEVGSLAAKLIMTDAAMGSITSEVGGGYDCDGHSSLDDHVNHDRKIVHVYYNGGPVFNVKRNDTDVTVLAHYDKMYCYHSRRSTCNTSVHTPPDQIQADNVPVTAAQTPAPAVVEMSVGKGRVILSGVHPEVSTSHLESELARLRKNHKRAEEAKHLGEDVLSLLQDQKYQKLLRYLVLRLFNSTETWDHGSPSSLATLVRAAAGSSFEAERGDVMEAESKL